MFVRDVSDVLGKASAISRGDKDAARVGVDVNGFPVVGVCEEV